MSLYQLTATDIVIRTSDGASIPPDERNTDWMEYQRWLAEGNTPDPVPVPSPEEQAAALIAAATALAQHRLDTFARQRNYDGILSACTYATSTVPRFASDGQACVNGRDATWATLYAILAQVQAGERPMPSLAEVEAELPALAWAEVAP